MVRPPVSGIVKPMLSVASETVDPLMTGALGARAGLCVTVLLATAFAPPPERTT